MKRVIKSATKASSHPDYEFYTDFSVGSTKFGAHYNVQGELLTNGYVTSYHPYDDAEYTWARFEGPQVTFIRDQKVLDKMTLSDYDESMYDCTFDEYLEYTFEDIAKQIKEFDSDVEPRMVHN